MCATAVIMMACADDSSSDLAPGNNGSESSGTGGSLARFAVSGDVLYTVDHTNLKVFNIADPGQPVKQGDVSIGTGIETIFPKGNALFIGSQTGMFIYDVTNPIVPTQLSVYEHVFSCDPVVADDQYAYVTLRSIIGRNNGRCWRGVNQMDIIDIKDLSNPDLLTSYPMAGPQGLGIDGNTLFVCDEGLKVYDASDPLSLELKEHFEIDARDVIPMNGVLMVIGDDGLFQYRYENQNLTLLSKL